MDSAHLKFSVMAYVGVARVFLGMTRPGGAARAARQKVPDLGAKHSHSSGYGEHLHAFWHDERADRKTLSLSGFDDGLEAAVDHSLAIEGHVRRVMLHAIHRLLHTFVARFATFASQTAATAPRTSTQRWTVQGLA